MDGLGADDKERKMSEFKSPPWDVKNIRIETGDDSDAWLVAEVFSDEEFSISFKPGRRAPATDEITWEMNMDVARRLRDFLNYAVPNVELTGAALAASRERSERG